ncbi:MAG: PAS domain-containing protein [Planctomycetota bacterium]
MTAQRGENHRGADPLLRRILETSIEGVLVFRAVREGGRTTDFVFELANPSACLMCARSEDQLLGAQLSDLFPGNWEDGLFQAYARTADEGTPFDTTVHYAHDGLDTDFQIRVRRLDDERVLLTFSDVSGVQRNARRIEQFLDGTPQPLVELDRDGRIVQANAALRALCDCGGEDLRSMHLTDLAHPDDREMLTEHLSRTSSGEDGVWVTHRLCDRGSGRWIKWLCSRGENGGVFAAGHDITLERELEQQAFDHQERFRLVAAAASDGLWDWHITKDELYWSDRAKAIMGFEPWEIDPSVDRWSEQIHPDDRAAVLKAIDNHLLRGVPYRIEYRFLHTSGRYIWCRSTGQAEWADDLTPIRMAGTVEDITREHEAAERLRSRDRLLELFVRHTPAAIAMLDRDMRYVVASEQWATDYELNGEALVGRSHYELFPTVPEHWRNRHRRCLAGESLSGDHEAYVHHNGTMMYLRWAMLPWHDERGEVGGIIIFTEEITGRVEAERALRVSEERLRLAQQGGGTGAWDWFITSNEVAFDEVWFTMLGYAPGELPESFATFLDLMHPDDRNVCERSIADHAAGRSENHRAEIRLRTKDGAWKWVLTEGRIVERDMVGQPTRMTGFHFDIDSIKRGESELREAKEKAEAASRAKSNFLTNISHEIRTPMTAILGYADVLERGEGTEQDRAEHLSSIRTAGEHLLTLINDVLDISKIEAGRMTTENARCDL